MSEKEVKLVMSLEEAEVVKSLLVRGFSSYNEQGQLDDELFEIGKSAISELIDLIKEAKAG